MHPYTDKLPELNDLPFSELLKSYARLDKLTTEEQVGVITFILDKLNNYFLSESFTKRLDTNMDYIVTSWRGAVCDLTVPALMAGLYEILKGRTEFMEEPPKNGIVFHSLCTNGHHNKVPSRTAPANAPQLEDVEAREKSQETAKANLAKIRELLKGSFTRVNPGTTSGPTKGEAQVNQTSLDKQYDELRRQPMKFCHQDGVTYYADLGCGYCSGRLKRPFWV